jgi:hypothetical protein
MYEIKKSFGRLGWGEVFIGNGGGGSDPTGAGQVSSGSGRNPLTGDMSTFVCSMVDKCNQDGWDTEGCRGFMQSFNCVKGVDSRMIYTDPDAFADGRGCGASGNPKFRCAEEAVGQPAPGSENNDPCNKFARNRNSLKDFGPNIGPENTTPIDPDIIDLPGKDGSKNPKPDPRSFEVPKDLQNQMPARPNFNPKPKPQNSTKDLPKNKERYD